MNYDSVLSLQFYDADVHVLPDWQTSLTTHVLEKLPLSLA
jgi:hypothetical protein